MFDVGMKVVCVDDAPDHPKWHASDHPVKDQVYTIRWVGYRTKKCPPGVMLVEIFGGIHPDGKEYAFRATRFRPLIERKTDISFAHEILRKVTRKDRVRA